MGGSGEVKLVGWCDGMEDVLLWFMSCSVSFFGGCESPLMVGGGCCEKGGGYVVGPSIFIFGGDDGNRDRYFGCSVRGDCGEWGGLGVVDFVFVVVVTVAEIFDLKVTES